MREQMKIVSDVEAHSRIKTESALPKVRHVMHVIRQDILRQFVELRTKETTVKKLEAAACSYSDSDSDSQSGAKDIFGLKQINLITKSQPKLTVKINGFPIWMLVDSGSSINVIDEPTLDKIKQKGRYSCICLRFKQNTPN